MKTEENKKGWKVNKEQREANSDKKQRVNKINTHKVAHIITPTDKKPLIIVEVTNIKAVNKKNNKIVIRVIEDIDTLEEKDIVITPETFEKLLKGEKTNGYQISTSLKDKRYLEEDEDEDLSDYEYKRKYPLENVKEIDEENKSNVKTATSKSHIVPEPQTMSIEEFKELPQEQIVWLLNNEANGDIRHLHRELKFYLQRMSSYTYKGLQEIIYPKLSLQKSTSPGEFLEMLEQKTKEYFQ